MFHLVSSMYLGIWLPACLCWAITLQEKLGLISSQPLVERGWLVQILSCPLSQCLISTIMSVCCPAFNCQHRLHSQSCQECGILQQIQFLSNSFICSLCSFSHFSFSDNPGKTLVLRYFYTSTAFVKYVKLSPFWCSLAFQLATPCSSLCLLYSNLWNQIFSSQFVLLKFCLLVSTETKLT